MHARGGGESQPAASHVAAMMALGKDEVVLWPLW
eukprot:SAG25_NODE_509_length_7302_cov_4.038723_1_plen_33_part_10